MALKYFVTIELIKRKIDYPTLVLVIHCVMAFESILIGNLSFENIVFFSSSVCFCSRFFFLSTDGIQSKI